MTQKPPRSDSGLLRTFMDIFPSNWFAPKSRLRQYITYSLIRHSILYFILILYFSYYFQYRKTFRILIKSLFISPRFFQCFF